MCVLTGRLYAVAHCMPFRSDEHDSVPAGSRSKCQRHDEGLSCLHPAVYSVCCTYVFICALYTCISVYVPYQCPSVIGAEFLKSDALPDINQYWERILDILSSASNRLLREGTSLPFMSAVKASNRKRHCPKDAQNRKKMKKESQGNQLHGFTWKMVVKTACVLQFLPIYFIYGIYLTLEVT